MDQSAFVGFIAVAVVLAILYVLPFIFSKKLRPGWLLFTLVIFILDTLFMLIDVGVQSDMLIDYLSRQTPRSNTETFKSASRSLLIFFVSFWR